MHKVIKKFFDDAYNEGELVAKAIKDITKKLSPYNQGMEDQNVYEMLRTYGINNIIFQKKASVIFKECSVSNKIISNDEIFGYSVIVIDQNGNKKGEMVKSKRFCTLEKSVLILYRFLRMIVVFPFANLLMLES
jgi:hypothetical protein